MTDTIESPQTKVAELQAALEVGREKKFEYRQLLKDFKKQRPEPGTRILAFSPCYPKGSPERLRMVTVIPVGMEEVTAYATEQDLNDAFMKTIDNFESTAPDGEAGVL